MNISSIARFIQMLDHELQENPACKIVYCVNIGRRELTNAVFLLGAYLILRLGETAADAISSFAWLNSEMVETYRDATYSRVDFGLSIEDCWRGLEKGIQHGWIRYNSVSSEWGKIDIDEYTELDSPLNADLNKIVPDKLIAFRGPKDLEGETYTDEEQSCRRFSPQHYVPLFRDLGVTDVVRLNQPEYDPAAFAAAGISHHDLPFDDCTAPPDAVVRRFLDIVDAGAGGGGGALQRGAGADGDADRAVADAAGGVRGAGGDGVAADHAAGVGDRGAAALPVRSGVGPVCPARGRW